MYNASASGAARSHIKYYVQGNKFLLDMESFAEGVINNIENRVDICQNFQSILQDKTGLTTAYDRKGGLVILEAADTPEAMQKLDSLIDNQVQEWFNNAVATVTPESKFGAPALPESYHYPATTVERDPALGTRYLEAIKPKMYASTSPSSPKVEKKTLRDHAKGIQHFLGIG